MMRERIGDVSPSVRRRALAWLRVAVGITLVVVLLQRIELPSLAAHPWRVVIGGVAGTVTALLVAQWASALRWRAVLGEDAPGVAHLFRLYLVGQFFGLFLPTSVGGDAVRAVALTRELRGGAVGATRAVASIVADRLAGVMALAAWLALGLALAASGAPGLGPLASPGMHFDAKWGVAIGGAVGLALLAAREGWRRLARSGRGRGAIAAMRDIGRRSPADWWRLGLLSLAVQGCYLLAWGGLVLALQLPVPLPALLVLVPLVSIAAMAPFTLSGLGVREGAWVVLLLPFGVQPGDALACSLLYFAAFVIVGAMGGLWFAARGTGGDGRDRPHASGLSAAESVPR